MCVRITGVTHTHAQSDSPLLPVALARQPGRSVLGEQLSEVRGQRLQMNDPDVSGCGRVTFGSGERTDPETPGAERRSQATFKNGTIHTDYYI